MAAKAMVFYLCTGRMYTDGLKIRDYLEQEYTCVRLVCKNFDKYGRLLAQVTTASGQDVACELVQKKLATVYNGGKKMTDEAQLDALRACPSQQ
jgi:endonuclease YncB( thermonuclease family)